jgi:cytochrome P450
MTTAHAPALFAPGRGLRPRLPLDLSDKAFIKNPNPTFDWLLEHEPVTRGKLSLMRPYLVSRYDDCLAVLKDKTRVTRTRARAHGKEGKGGYPVPRSLKHLVSSMVNTDDPEHRRLRELVHRAFTPQALRAIEHRVADSCSRLLDDAFERGDTVDLIPRLCLPLPVAVISEMMGVDHKVMPVFINGVSFMSGGMSALNLARGVLWDLPKLDRLLRQIVAEKKQAPGDDILSGLISAELDGDKLTEDEVIGLAFILTFAGYETTVYLIANALLMLLVHPEQRELALSSAEHLEAAIEETLRFHSSALGTEANYALEDLELGGTLIPKGSAIFPLLGAGNRDPRVFERPEVFDITRTPNKHLGFGQGIHYCVGAPLARMETRTALRQLFDRAPDLELAVAPEQLEVQPVPLMRRYRALPVHLHL